MAQFSCASSAALLNVITMRNNTITTITHLLSCYESNSPGPIPNGVILVCFDILNIIIIINKEQKHICLVVNIC